MVLCRIYIPSVDGFYVLTRIVKKRMSYYLKNLCLLNNFLVDRVMRVKKIIGFTPGLLNVSSTRGTLQNKTKTMDVRRLTT